MPSVAVLSELHSQIFAVVPCVLNEFSFVTFTSEREGAVTLTLGTIRIKTGTYWFNDVGNSSECTYEGFRD
jgi:hypothetical protein